MFDELCRCRQSEKSELISEVLKENSAGQIELFYDLQKRITGSYLRKHGFYDVDAESIVSDVFMYMLNEKFAPFVSKNISFNSYLGMLIAKLTKEQVADNLGVELDVYLNYLKIRDVCDEYHIPLDSKNAYKIQYLLEKPMNITTIKRAIEQMTFANKARNYGEFELMTEQCAI